MQRSRSLQSSLKPSGGGRSSGKSVRFADWDGASLTRVRHLSADSGYTSDESPSTSDQQDICVKLHSYSSNGLFVGGTVHVVNPRYQHDDDEQLFIALSFDDWKTVSHIEGFRYNNNSTTDLISQWHFSAHLKDLYRTSRCVLKVEYTYGGRMTVDDNFGSFYSLQIEVPRRSYQYSQETLICDLLSFDELLIY
ncbi:hypothetical protein AB6A40_008707 [Gnathostoma spinigerum]|uniref:CBM21 domain-containing protein n=1 Tax=Gnathostoma spinigerum TaxID=75299 RepID=A0ABD6EPW5_9BILA